MWAEYLSLCMAPEYSTQCGAAYCSAFFVSIVSCFPLPQVVVLNKIDLPEVEDKRKDLEQALKQHMGHTRLSRAVGKSSVTLKLAKHASSNKNHAVLLGPSTG